MKVFLMFRDKDFDLEQSLPENQKDLVQDLELETLFKTMATGDSLTLEVVKKVILAGCDQIDTILYRQDILKDCLKNPEIVREIFKIANEAIEKRKEHHLGIFFRNPSSILSGSVNLLEMLLEMLKQLREMTDNYAHKFESTGFKQFFSILAEELNDEFFNTAHSHLQELRFKNGTLISAELGEGNEGTNFILHKNSNQGWFNQMWSKLAFSKSSLFTFKIHPRDDSGFRAISKIKDKALNQTADTMAQAAEHVLDFFKKLRVEIAFYIGCLNLFEILEQMGEPVTFPRPVKNSEREHSFQELYDVCLALTMEEMVVGNDLDGYNKELMIITGANQGGKTTFLRSIGIAQIMMQAGMFVPAKFFSANFCQGLFTHFKRKEDSDMESGKFDEELKRMNEIVANLQSNSLVLFNESFASTTEREGSEIARQIVRALLERNIKIFFVTHLYDFADSFYQEQKDNVIFLRAERKNNGERTFKIIPGKPLQTSYGKDLYQKIFI